MSTETTPKAPTNLVVVLLDSLNRHLLEPYGSDEFDMPVLSRFARESLRFTRHHVGSLPCMPARHDILVGSLDFLWRPWGSIEVWEDAVTRALRPAGVTTMLVSDHPHLFETGGENYHTDFTAWAYERGHENDAWRTRPDPSWVGTPALPAATPAVHHYYDDARTWFRSEEDFPGPRTMTAAAQWLRTSAPHHDRFMLFVDEFDPHEPFDTPEPYAGMYDPDWDEPLVIWPPYATDAVARGRIDERTARHIRANYGSKVTMIDHWFGTVLDAIDEAGLRDSTAVVVCTDHGHYLGEHDVFGKPDAPIYSEMGRIPLLVRWPGAAPRDIDALTTSVDLHATIADFFGVSVEHPTNGRSLLPLIDGSATSIRDYALFGYWSRHVGITDGRRRYLRGCGESNFPLSMWSNRWSTMPLHKYPGTRLPRPDRHATLEIMPGTDTAVIRRIFGPGDALPYWALAGAPNRNLLWDVDDDPGETADLAGTAREAELVDLLRTALDDVRAPADQFERLGLA